MSGTSTCSHIVGSPAMCTNNLPSKTRGKKSEEGFGKKNNISSKKERQAALQMGREGGDVKEKYGWNKVLED